VAFNCSENPADTASSQGTLKISLTDAPGDYEAVNIKFSEVSVNFNDEWKVLNGQTQEYNLLNLSNGTTALLAEHQLEPGAYSQIRLKITEANVVYKGQTFSLDVPSGAQSGLKFGLQLTLESGGTQELIVDFDANKSIVPQGPRHNFHGFTLKPRIRVCARNSTGSVTGIVTNPENLPVAYAISGTDTVTTTMVDGTSGNFVLSFLPEGTYTVSVEDTAGLSFSNAGVAVTAGQENDLGQITLQ